MEKFTKGPWVNKSDKGHYFGGAAAVNNVTDKASVALVYGKNNEEKDANAWLIACAPEMYAILQAILNDDYNNVGEMKDAVNYILAKVNQ